MKVYHGSYTEIVEIDLSKSRDNRDFGKGFYVTNIRSQAEYWAVRMGKLHGTEGVVTEFTLLYLKDWQKIYGMLKMELEMAKKSASSAG